ncbi:MAG: hypothetical protein OJF50_000570 [Nitrospira sp.]|nr:hypothetical protein [Nitrospira sp.]
MESMMTEWGGTENSNGSLTPGYAKNPQDWSPPGMSGEAAIR